MVERTPPPEDFSDREAVEAWLREQPREFAVAIAARVALRALPFIMDGIDDTDQFKSIQPITIFSISCVNYFASSKYKLDMKANKFIKYQYKSAIGIAERLDRTSESLKETARRSTEIKDSGSLIYRMHAEDTESTANAIRCAISASAAHQNSEFMIDYNSILNTALMQPNHGYKNYSPAKLDHSTFRDAFHADAKRISSADKGLEGILSHPLWAAATPAKVDERWSELKRGLLSAADEGWEVWTEWYEARLRGDPFDPALEEARVLIPDALWEQSPKAVNAEIARLVADRRAETHRALLDRIAALEARLAAMDAAKPAPLGHNNPPEPIDEEAEAIRAGLEALKAQPVAPADPSPTVSAVNRLRAALGRLTGYVGRQLDHFISEASKTAGKAAGVALVAGAAGYAIDLAGVIDAAVAWLRALGAPI